MTRDEVRQLSAWEYLDPWTFATARDSVAGINAQIARGRKLAAQFAEIVIRPDGSWSGLRPGLIYSERDTVIGATANSCGLLRGFLKSDTGTPLYVERFGVRVRIK